MIDVIDRIVNVMLRMGLPSWLSGREPTCKMQEMPVQSLGQNRSPGVGSGNPPQYSCLKMFMDRGTWQATVHGITKSWT